MLVIFKRGFGEDKRSPQAYYQMAKPRIEFYVNDKEMEVILYIILCNVFSLFFYSSHIYIIIWTVQPYSHFGAHKSLQNKQELI